MTGFLGQWWNHPFTKYYWHPQFGTNIPSSFHLPPPFDKVGQPLMHRSALPQCTGEVGGWGVPGLGLWKGEALIKKLLRKMVWMVKFSRVFLLVLLWCFKGNGPIWPFLFLKKVLERLTQFTMFCFFRKLLTVGVPWGYDCYPPGV